MNLQDIRKKSVAEATGDGKFDSMMGKITGNTTPQGFDQARADRVQDKAEMPDDETIDALNKMMFDLHKSMQTAEQLIRKLSSKR